MKNSLLQQTNPFHQRIPIKSIRVTCESLTDNWLREGLMESLNRRDREREQNTRNFISKIIYDFYAYQGNDNLIDLQHS